MILGQNAPRLSMPGTDERRVLTRFAWYPVRLSDGRWLWWDRYVEIRGPKYAPVEYWCGLRTPAWDLLYRVTWEEYTRNPRYQPRDLLRTGIRR